MNKILIIYLILFFTSCTPQMKNNPKYIRKESESFNLSLMKFKENIDILTSKTEVFITTIVNKNNQEKSFEEVLSNDTIKAYKYAIQNQRCKNLGEKFFKYDNEFSFNNISFLTNNEKEIVAYETSIFYEGNQKEIYNFIAFLKNKFKIKPKKNKMLGELTVYQWDTLDYFVQLVNCTSKEKEETYIDGKHTVKYTYYVKLNVYNKKTLNNEIKKTISRDLDFVVYSKSHFHN